MEPRYTASTRLALAILAAIFAVQVYQAAARPIASSEAYLYDRFVRPSARQVWAQGLPDRDPLYAILEKRSVGLFHVSPFSVRLPSLAFLVLYLWAVWRLASLVGTKGWSHAAVVVSAAAVPLWEGWFVAANGFGMALALQLCGLGVAVKYFVLLQEDRASYLNLCGVFLGLSIAADVNFAATAGGLAVCTLLGLSRNPGAVLLWAERVLIPGVVTAFVLLVLPLTHSGRSEVRAELTAPQALQAEGLLGTLRATAGSQAISIGASPAVEPIVEFYRAQHRATNWRRAVPGLAGSTFDYYLLAGSDTIYVEQLHLIVLAGDAGILLARRRHDPL